MATSKDFDLANKSAELKGENLSVKVGNVFQAVLESFDRILETKNYQVASPAKNNATGWDVLFPRTEANEGLIRHVVRGGDGFHALRMGVIPDGGRHFMVLWVDIVVTPERIALSMGGNPMDLNLETFDASAASEEIDKLVRTATDDLLQLNLSERGVFRHLLEHFDR